MLSFPTCTCIWFLPLTNFPCFLLFLLYFSHTENIHIPSFVSIPAFHVPIPSTHVWIYPKYFGAFPTLLTSWLLDISTHMTDKMCTAFVIQLVPATSFLRLTPHTFFAFPLICSPHVYPRWDNLPTFCYELLVLFW